MFERFMFRKIELWLLGILLVAGLLAGVLFGAIVRATALGSDRYGQVGEIALKVAEFPRDARDALAVLIYGENRDLQAIEQRFEGQAGFRFSTAPGSRPDAGYLLLSRYDGDRQRSIVELVDLNSQAVIHFWVPDIAAINSRTKLVSKLVDIKRDNTPGRARVVHPLLTGRGEIVFSDMPGPLVKIDACSATTWTIDRLFHHSKELSADGNYWSIVNVEPQSIAGVSDVFIEDAIILVSPDGRILYEKSVPELLIENGYSRLIYGLDFYTDDPVHLNDVQEVASDGPYWQKGDVFLSLRNISAIVLYRPSENRVVWLKQGPWVNQHDVDILDESRIAIFNNNKFNYQKSVVVDGSNEVMIYDFATGETTSPYREAMRRLDIRTVAQGRSEILADGRVVLEETNYGRTLMLDRQGKVIWSYVNRASDGQVYLLNWSRVISRADGDRITPVLAAAACPPL